MYDYILQYLDKTYTVGLDGYKTNEINERYEYGNEIVKSLVEIFTVNSDIAYDIFYSWTLKLGLSKNIFDNFYLKKDLGVFWTPEIYQDIHAIDAEAELIFIISKQIATEIDAQILIDNIGQFNSNDFLSVMKCLGYQTSETIYNPHTFLPMKRFIPTSIIEMQNERQNNIIWQNWVRTREQNQEA